MSIIISDVRTVNEHKYRDVEYTINHPELGEVPTDVRTEVLTNCGAWVEFDIKCSNSACSDMTCKCQKNILEEVGI